MGIQRRTWKSGKSLYYARLTHDGKSEISGGFATRAAAERALATIRLRLESERIGLPAPVVLNDPTIRDLLGDPDALEPEAGSYLAWKDRPGAKNCAPLYLRRLRTAIRALIPFWGDRRVSEINADTLAEYQAQRLSAPLKMGQKAHLAAVARRKEAGMPEPKRRPVKTTAKLQLVRGKGAEPRTVGPACVNREVMALRGALTWAADPTRDPKRRIAPVPWPREIMVTEPAPRNEVLLPDDEARLLRDCRPEWLRDVAILMRGTGLRSGEALALEWPAVNLDEGTLVVTRSKSGHKRAVPLQDDVVTMLRDRQRLAKDDNPLVFTTRTGLAITSSKAASTFLAVAIRLNLKTEDGGRPTLHSLRHSIASRIMRQGFADAEVAALLGHSRTSEVTRRYLHSNMDRMRSMTSAAAPGTRPKLILLDSKKDAAG